MKPFSNYPDITEDIPISLIGISFSDNYEGAVEDRRTITYTLDFEIKTQFFGPISDSKIIRKAIVDIKDSDTNSIIQRLTVEPNPTNINIIGDSDFNTTTTFLYPGEGDSI